MDLTCNYSLSSCLIFSHSVMRAYLSEVHWFSGYKTKIPVNKLTFQKQLTTNNKSQAAPFFPLQHQAESGSFLYAINTEHCTTLHPSCTHTDRKKQKHARTNQSQSHHSLPGQKCDVSHSDTWSAWNVWPDKLHTLVGTDLLTTSEWASVSLCVGWCLCTWCSSNAG